MTTPQMDLHETIDFWQGEVDRDAADPRERTRDGIASSTLRWLRELEALRTVILQSALGRVIEALQSEQRIDAITPNNAHGEWPGGE